MRAPLTLVKKDTSGAEGAPYAKTQGGAAAPGRPSLYPPLLNSLSPQRNLNFQLGPRNRYEEFGPLRKSVDGFGKNRPISSRE